MAATPLSSNALTGSASQTLLFVTVKMTAAMHQMKNPVVSMVCIN